MPKKCDYICFSKEEFERLTKSKPKKAAKRPTRKASATKKTTSKVSRTKRTVKTVQKPKRPTRKASATKKMASKVSVSVNTNPTTVNNLYLMGGGSEPTSVRKKPYRHYTAPFLQRRSGPVDVAPIREKTVYIEREPTPMLVESEKKVERPKRKLLTGKGKKQKDRTELLPSGQVDDGNPRTELLPSGQVDDDGNIIMIPQKTG